MAIGTITQDRPDGWINGVTGEKVNNTTAPKANDALDKDAFLRLLTTQLSNQDPLSPVDNTQQIAQMAQFSSLEQMQNMNTTLLVNEAGNMIGRNITWSDASGGTQVGLVDGMTIINGAPMLMVGNSLVDISKVTGMASANSNNGNLAIGASSLIGQKVTWIDAVNQTVSWTDANGKSQSGKVTGVTYQGGNPYLAVGDQKIALDKVNEKDKLLKSGEVESVKLMGGGQILCIKGKDEMINIDSVIQVG